MKAELIIDKGTFVHVHLSERNLLTLLSKLYTEGSEVTLVKDITNARVVVSATRDEHHYTDGDKGLMHPVTERILAAIKEATQGVKI